MSRPRNDTRERIQQIALRLFTEKGYDKTSLREIAAQLGVTKAALYYHFTSKEQIVESIMQDSQTAVDELIDWAAALSATPESRIEILRRLLNLVDTRWRPMIRFAQANQAQMRKFRDAEGMVNQIRRISILVRDPSGGPTEAYKALLAVIALFFAVTMPEQLSSEIGIGVDLPEIALDVATELISSRPREAREL